MTSWRINRHGGDPLMLDTETGVYGLQDFFDTCVAGKVGSYELCDGTIVLASAEVGPRGAQIAWRPEWILYAIGVRQASVDVPGVVAFLREQGVLPKEDE